MTIKNRRLNVPVKGISRSRYAVAYTLPKSYKLRKRLCDRPKEKKFKVGALDVENMFQFMEVKPEKFDQHLPTSVIPQSGTALTQATNSSEVDTSM